MVIQDFIRMACVRAPKQQLKLEPLLPHRASKLLHLSSAQAGMQPRGRQ